MQETDGSLHGMRLVKAGVRPWVWGQCKLIRGLCTNLSYVWMSTTDTCCRLKVHVNKLYIVCKDYTECESACQQSLSNVVYYGWWVFLFSVVSMLVECSLQSCLELAVKNYTQRSHRDSPRWPWLVYQVCSYGNTDEQWMGLDPHSTHISSAAFHDIVIMGWLCFFHCCFFKCVAIATHLKKQQWKKHSHPIITMSWKAAELMWVECGSKPIHCSSVLP